MSKRAKAALASGLGLVMLTATYLTAPWEGTENDAYWDRLGKVWTVCTGETKGVKKGDTHTDAECRDMLYRTLEKDYRQPLQKCVKNYDDLPLSLQAAMLDAAYNVGAGAICRSTAARRSMAGDLAGACKALTWFNKAGGKTIRGLVLRRETGDATRIGEYELCMTGLEMPAGLDLDDVAAVPPAKPKPADRPAPEPRSETKPAPKAAPEAVALPWPWLAGFGAVVLIAVGAAIVVRRRRRGA